MPPSQTLEKSSVWWSLQAATKEAVVAVVEKQKQVCGLAVSSHLLKVKSAYLLMQLLLLSDHWTVS